MTSKVKFLSFYISAYDDLTQREKGSIIYNNLIDIFFEEHNVIKWEVVQGISGEGVWKSPVIMIEYEK